MNYNIDYSDASNRQEIIGIYSLYYYIVSGASYAFDIGNLVISLLIYMVEEGRLNAYAMKVYEIKTFINEYLTGIEYVDEYNLDEIAENLISKLQGAKPNGDPIKFEYYDHEIRSVKSVKVAYVDYSLKDEGFKITDKGLEFLISSKEIPQEAKLTVALYLFKLQLEKKKYKAALNTIKSINLETLRQLDIKTEILSMNRFGREEASRLYKKYWGDFFDLRSEETSHYEDAKERLQLYKESEYLEKNNITLTPEDIEVLRAIEIELSKSSNLQALYTNEISKMPVEMLEIDKSSMINIFLSLFNLQEHFDESGQFAPQTASERQQYRYWMHYAEGSLMPLLIMQLVMENVPKYVPWLIKPIAQKITGGVKGGFIKPRLKDHLEFLEHHLSSHDYFAGQFSFADIQMSFPLQALQSRIKGKYPHIQAFVQRMRSRSAFQHALQKEQALN